MPINNPPGWFTPNATGLTYASPDEKLIMNKFHVFWVIERLLKEPKRTKWQDVMIPLALFIGLLLAYLPSNSNFRDFLGVPAATWQAIIIISMGISLLLAIFLFVKWCIGIAKNPVKTTEQIYDEITEQMQKDWNKLPSR
jgi:hypothetical protein